MLKFESVPKPHCPSVANCVGATEQPSHWHNTPIAIVLTISECPRNGWFSYIISLNFYNALIELLLSLYWQESWVLQWLYNVLNCQTVGSEERGTLKARQVSRQGRWVKSLHREGVQGLGNLPGPDGLYLDSL